MIKKQKLNRFLELDALRGIAALAVLLYHFTTRYDEIYGHADLVFSVDYGFVGVQIFFILSGFVIYMSLERVKSIKDFVKRRAKRLYPVYWAAVLTTFAVVSIFGLPGREVSLGSMMLNFLMFHGYLLVDNVDNVYWSLKVELTFYFWMGLLLFFNKTQKIEEFSILWLIAMIIFSFLEFPYIGYLKAMLLLDYGALFIAGITFYRIYKYGFSWRRAGILLGTYLVYSLAVSTSIMLGLIALTYLAFMLFIAGRLSFLSNRVLVYFGAISYPLYLVHQNIGYVTINKLYDFGVTSNLLLVCIPIGVTVLIADLLNRFVDIPFQSYLKKFI